MLSPLIDHYAVKRPIDWTRQFGRRAPLHVEIGFGYGETLVRSASACSGDDFIGIEQIWERIYKTLKRIHGATPPLKNIRILGMDARVALERLFAEKSIHHLYALFPCPWPKKGHVKYRLFNRIFLKLANNRLVAGGQIKVVTDSQAFHAWMVEQLPGTGFSHSFQNITAQFDTKYERKWRQQGIEKFYELVLTKKRHLSQPTIEDILLKTYQLDSCDPQKFKMPSQPVHFSLDGKKGQGTVVFKDYMFDPQKQRGLVSLIVAEEHLTQSFRVAIVKSTSGPGKALPFAGGSHGRAGPATGGGWRVFKADNQQFFPTPGIAKSIEVVYSALQSPENF